MPLADRDCQFLYTTCSIDTQENEEQVAYFQKQYGLKQMCAKSLLPNGSGTSYHDGGFASVLQR